MGKFSLVGNIFIYTIIFFIKEGFQKYSQHYTFQKRFKVENFNELASQENLRGSHMTDQTSYF